MRDGTAHMARWQQIQAAVDRLPKVGGDGVYGRGGAPRDDDGVALEVVQLWLDLLPHRRRILHSHPRQRQRRGRRVLRSHATDGRREALDVLHADQQRPDAGARGVSGVCGAAGGALPKVTVRATPARFHKLLACFCLLWAHARWGCAGRSRHVSRACGHVARDRGARGRNHFHVAAHAVLHPAIPRLWFLLYRPGGDDEARRHEVRSPHDRRCARLHAGNPHANGPQLRRRVSRRRAWRPLAGVQPPALQHALHGAGRRVLGRAGVRVHGHPANHHLYPALPPLHRHCAAQPDDCHVLRHLRAHPDAGRTPVGTKSC
mmetsp:Transcript_9259/g.23472  ORF Transcript_9259/g.23472 Transcript_9259/m.23472 type:complete len:318 (+) Transcript_9259:752-1705(+)